MSGEKGKSGGRRPGAGRPAYFKCSRDDLLIVERSSLNEARFDKPELGRVVGIKAGELELQIGYDILVIRFPDDGEVQEIELWKPKKIG